MVWTGTQDLLDRFIQTLNQNCLNLKFTVSTNLQRITFLDLTIFKDNNENCLASTLYRKETTGNTLLHANSAHPRPLIKSISYAQYLRLRRNCTHIEEFKSQADALRIRLLARGYTKTLLRSTYNKAICQSRSSLLYKKKSIATNSPVRFITRFSQQHEQLCGILSNHWPILQEDPIIKKYIGPFPQITFRRARSLGDKLTSSYYSTTPKHKQLKQGISQCGKCSFCPWIKVGKTFILPNGETFTPKFHVNCDTEGVVSYVMPMRCLLCRQNY